jgi:hypothetical protein
MLSTEGCDFLTSYGKTSHFRVAVLPKNDEKHVKFGVKGIILLQEHTVRSIILRVPSSFAEFMEMMTGD